MRLGISPLQATYVGLWDLTIQEIYADPPYYGCTRQEPERAIDSIFHYGVREHETVLSFPDKLVEVYC